MDLTPRNKDLEETGQSGLGLCWGGGGPPKGRGGFEWALIFITNEIPYLNSSPD